jgi:tetratricopeptide (TPR) repeat protein
MRLFSLLLLIAILAGAAFVVPDARARDPAHPDAIPPLANPFLAEPLPAMTGGDATSSTHALALGVREALTIKEEITLRPPARTDERLDALFERLADAGDVTEARGVVRLINRQWLRSGSDTADLLMTRAREAAREHDHALAIELFDRIIAMEPDWAEAWNRRAVAFHRLGDPLSAMADIHRAVTLEPRHFGAWAGLGHILRESGDEAAALASYEHALSIHPHIPRLEPIVEKLRRDLYGMDL